MCDECRLWPALTRAAEIYWDLYCICSTNVISNLSSVLYRHDEHLSITGFASRGTFNDGINDILGGDIRDDAFDFDLLVEVNRVLFTAPLAFLHCSALHV